MFLSMSQTSQAILLALVGFACFSTSDILFKLLSSEYSVFQILSWTSISSLLSAFLISPWLGGIKKPFKSTKKNIHLLRAIFSLCISTTLVTAYAYLPVSTVYSLLFTTPFIATLYAIVLFKEKIEPKNWFIILFGFVGVLIIIRPGFTVFDPWFVLPIIATFFVAVFFTLARYFNEEESILSFALYPDILKVFVLGVYTALNYSLLPEVKDIPYFIISGILVMCAIITTALAFRMAKTSLISPLMYTQMLWAVGLGYLVFNHIPDAWTMTGALIIIICGIAIIHRDNSQKKVS